VHAVFCVTIRLNSSQIHQQHMATSTIEEQAVRVLRFPLMGLASGLVVISLLALDFRIDTIHIVIAIVLFAVALSASYRLADSLARRFAEHISSAFELLRQQSEATLQTERPLEYSTDVTEAMELSAVTRRLVERTAEVRQEMKRLEQVRSQFLANVSHELRTPVFAIQGYLETLLEGAENDDKVRHTFIDKAHANARRLNVLLGDLIDISRIESGEMRMSFRFFNIVDVAREVCSALEGMSTAQSVKLSVDAPREVLPVLGDKERITQVLSNLVSNAIRYNKPDGSVVVRFVKEDQYLRIEVEDTGIGIAEEHLPRLFERFYRIDSHRSRATGGSGLGLAIVKHILEAHETAPEIISKENEGTRIVFRLRY
jgi:two-component system phosphate regulon sensor histidine kinase PhoR